MGGFVRQAIADGLIAAAHDVSDGGLLVALAEMCLPHQIGCQIEATGDTGFWFGEDQSRYVLATKQGEKLQAAAKKQKLPLILLGKTGGAELTIGDKHRISVAELAKAHESWLPDYVGQ